MLLLLEREDVDLCRESDGWVWVEVLRLLAERGSRGKEGEEGEECEREEGDVWDEDWEAHFVFVYRRC